MEFSITLPSRGGTEILTSSGVNSTELAADAKLVIRRKHRRGRRLETSLKKRLHKLKEHVRNARNFVRAFKKVSKEDALNLNSKHRGGGVPGVQSSDNSLSDDLAMSGKNYKNQSKNFIGPRHLTTISTFNCRTLKSNW